VQGGSGGGSPTLSSLSQSSGTIGTSVTVYGNGFTPSGSVQISFGGVAAGTVTANGNGQIDPVKGEEGATTAYLRGQLMATLALTPQP